MTEKIRLLIEDFLRRNSLLTILTGAGVSAESGIPTYRGMEGYWTEGSQHYQPQEIGTFKMFKKHPYEVWKFALYRRSVCMAAQPNNAH